MEHRMEAFYQLWVLMENERKKSIWNVNMNKVINPTATNR